MADTANHPTPPAGEPCPSCDGYGVEPKPPARPVQQCSACGGSGRKGGWARRASDAADPARRVTATELNRILLAQLTRPTRDRSSVSITRNAKHQVQFEITVYAGDAGADTLEDAETLATAIADRLAVKYPPPPEPAT